MTPSRPADQADFLVVESTYGGRLHHETPIENALEKLIHAVTEQKGFLLILAFAIERTQQVLNRIRRLQEEGRVSELQATSMVNNYLMNPQMQCGQQ